MRTGRCCASEPPEATPVTSLRRTNQPSAHYGKPFQPTRGRTSGGGPWYERPRAYPTTAEIRDSRSLLPIIRVIAPARNVMLTLDWQVRRPRLIPFCPFPVLPILAPP